MPDSNSEDKVVITARSTRFGINEFRSEMSLNGILQPNRFIAVFSMPRGIKALSQYGRTKDKPYLEQNYQDSDNFISLRCENIVVPGVNFFTNDDIRRYGIGQIEKRPYLATFNPIRMQFVVDRNARVIQFFNDWTNGIVNYNTDLGMSPAKDVASKPYLLKYRDDFMSPTIRIWVYDQSNLITFGIKLYDAFPLTTSDVDLFWGADNEPLRYSVTMQYSHMSMQFVDSNGETFDLTGKQKLGTEPKSAENVYDDSLKEYRSPSLLEGILSTSGKMIQGEIYSGAETAINKAFDKIFR